MQSPSPTTLESFHLFSALPKDIRLMIWELTFTRRILPFNFCREPNINVSDHPEPALWVQDPSPPEQGLFAVPAMIIGPGGKMINNGAPLPPLALHTSFAPIFALSVNRESRGFALGLYHVWDLQFGKRKRSITWSSKLDTIFVQEKCEWRQGQPLFILIEKFRMQFPQQAKAVQSLALYTSHWNQKVLDRAAMVEKWVCFESLREIVAVLDSEYEIKREMVLLWQDQVNVQNLVVFGALVATEQTTKAVQEDGSAGMLWPGDAGSDLVEGKQERREWANWRVPKVRLVDEERLWGEGRDLEMLLRCHPCEDLETYRKTKRGRELDVSQHTFAEE